MLNQARLSAFRQSLKRPKDGDNIFDTPNARVVAQTFRQRKREFFIVSNLDQLSQLRTNGFLVERKFLIKDEDLDPFLTECPVCHHKQIKTTRVMKCNSCHNKITA